MRRPGGLPLLRATLFKLCSGSTCAFWMIIQTHLGIVTACDQKASLTLVSSQLVIRGLHAVARYVIMSCQLTPNLKPRLRVTTVVTLNSFGQRPIDRTPTLVDRNNSSIPAKPGRLFALFTGSRLFHRQSASLVGRESEISGESRGSSGD